MAQPWNPTPSVLLESAAENASRAYLSGLEASYQVPGQALEFLLPSLEYESKKGQHKLRLRQALENPASPEAAEYFTTPMEGRKAVLDNWVDSYFKEDFAQGADGELREKIRTEPDAQITKDWLNAPRTREAKDAVVRQYALRLAEQRYSEYLSRVKINQQAGVLAVKGGAFSYPNQTNLTEEQGVAIKGNQTWSRLPEQTREELMRRNVTSENIGQMIASGEEFKQFERENLIHKLQNGLVSLVDAAEWAMLGVPKMLPEAIQPANLVRKEFGIPVKEGQLTKLIRAGSRVPEGFITGAAQSLQETVPPAEIVSSTRPPRSLSASPKKNPNKLREGTPSVEQDTEVLGVRPKDITLADAFEAVKGGIKGAVSLTADGDPSKEYRALLINTHARNVERAKQKLTAENPDLTPEELDEKAKQLGQQLTDKDLARTQLQNPEMSQFLGEVALDVFNWVSPLGVARKAGALVKQTNRGKKLATGIAEHVTEPLARTFSPGGEYAEMERKVNDLVGLGEGTQLRTELEVAQAEGMGAFNKRRALADKARGLPELSEFERERVSDALMAGKSEGLSKSERKLYDQTKRLMKESQTVRESLPEAHRTVSETGELKEMTTRADYGHPTVLQKDVPKEIQEELDFLGMDNINQAMDVYHASLNKTGHERIFSKKTEAFILERLYLQEEAAGRVRSLEGVRRDITPESAMERKGSDFVKDPAAQSIYSFERMSTAEKVGTELKSIHEILDKRGMVQIVKKGDPKERAGRLFALKQRFGGVDFDVLHEGTPGLGGQLAKRYLMTNAKPGQKLSELETYLPRSVTERVKEIVPVVGKEDASYALKTGVEVWKSLMSTWRMGATVSIPAFTLTNATGAVTMTAIHSGLSAANPGKQRTALYGAFAAAFLKKESPARQLIYQLPDGTTTTVGKLIEEAQAYGLMGQGHLRLSEDVLQKYGTAPGKMVGGMEELTKFATTPFRKANQIIDDYQHFVGYVMGLKGSSKADKIAAAKFAMDKTGVYWIYNKGFDKVARNLTGFYGWNRFYVGFLTKAAAEHPNRLAFVQKLYDLGRNTGDIGATPQNLAEYDEFKGAYPAPEKFQPSKREQAMTGQHTIRYAQETPLGYLESLVGNKTKFALDNMSFVVKGAVIMATGWDPDTGEDVPEMSTRLKKAGLSIIARPLRFYYVGIYQHMLRNKDYAGVLSLATELQMYNESGGLIGKGEFPYKQRLTKPQQYEGKDALEKAKLYQKQEERLLEAVGNLNQ